MSTAIREHARQWCQVIGPRAAARKLNLPEGTVLGWSHRHKWQVPAVFQPVKDYFKKCAENQGVIISREAQESVMREQSEDSRLYLSSAVLKASHEFASIDPRELTDHRKSQALLNVSRTGDTVHGWNALRMQGVTVQVANLVMPSADERAALNQVDRRLDDISRRLQERSTSARNTPAE